MGVVGVSEGIGSLAEMGVGWGELVFESGEAPGRPGGVGCLSTIGVFALRS